MRKRAFYSPFFFLLASSLLVGPSARPAYASGYVVTTLVDDTVADSLCSLREAILAASNNPVNNDCGPGSASDDIIPLT